MSSPDKLYRNPLGDDTGRVSAVEQGLHRLPRPRAVIHGPPVYVHADERVGRLVPDRAVELPRVSQRGGPVLQRVDNAAPQIPRDLLDDLGPQIAPNCIAAERQWKAGLLQPP